MLEYDEVDHDLLEFMRAHMNGNGNYVNDVELTTGVLESAEHVCDVLLPIHFVLAAESQHALDVFISRDGCKSAAEKVHSFPY
jgi:hypothetical protein